MKFLLYILTLTSYIYATTLITPIPQSIEYDKEKALLGKKLFYDERLSKNNDMSCASCHFLQNGGDDDAIGSKGNNNQILARNSPTVYNAVFNESQHWDAGVPDLKGQAIASIVHPQAMNTNFVDIIDKLNKDTYYKKEIKRLYDSPITKDNILHAIVEFEKALITPNSKFDKYLNGELDILSKDELNGYIAFKEYGCISCHNGINIGGNLIQKIGILETYDTNDLGKFYLTNADEDMHNFKVPSLRNIELTAPYFHDGKVKTLEEAVKKMIRYQIGYVLSEKEVRNIIKFLRTLTGETPEIAELPNE